MSGKRYIRLLFCLPSMLSNTVMDDIKSNFGNTSYCIVSHALFTFAKFTVQQSLCTHII